MNRSRRRRLRLSFESLETRLALAAYYVAPNGSDSNNGSAAAPWLTLQKAANLVNPGHVRTRMRAQAFPGEDPATVQAPEDITPTFVRLAEPSCTDNGRLFDLPTGEVR